MKRVMSGRRSRMFMGKLLAGMTAAALFVSSLAAPGNAGRVYAKEKHGNTNRNLDIGKFPKTDAGI